LLKKYRGSMSGEHGDGIVRGEFLPFYDCWKLHWNEVKLAFIAINYELSTDQVSLKWMRIFLWNRKERARRFKHFKIFSDSMGILRAAENAMAHNDCQKYLRQVDQCVQLPRDKWKDTTRARASILRNTWPILKRK
jgi:hypothetical protein